MFEIPCSRCQTLISVEKQHPINYTGEVLCDNCYTDEVKAEENYYDFCVSAGKKYEKKSETMDEAVLEDSKFFKK